MAIVNRDLDRSEQLFTVDAVHGAVATGVSVIVGLVKAPGQCLGMRLSGRGLSGAPVYQLAVARWTSAGITNIALGSAVTLATAFGVSGGAIGISISASSTLAALQAGDLLVLNTSGANTAVTSLVVSAVMQAAQDIKKTHGL